MAETRTISRDLVVTITGPGWHYGIARLLIDTDSNAAVFLPGIDQPVQQFTAVVNRRQNGTGTQTDGDVTWRHKPSGCSFKLAKCRMGTDTLNRMWA